MLARLIFSPKQKQMKGFFIALFLLAFSSNIEAPMAHELKRIDISVPCVYGEKAEFFMKHARMANLIEQRYGIPLEICLAQAAIESDCGRSELSSVYHNMFGVKALGPDPFVEYADDLPNDKFVVYESEEKSFYDYALVLMHRRYSWMREKYGLDWEKWADGLQRCGYATNKKYGKILKNYVRSNKLSIYRHIAV